LSEKVSSKTPKELIQHFKDLNESGCWIGQDDSRKDTLKYIIEELSKTVEDLVAESTVIWEAINNRFNSMISANKRIGFTELDLQAFRNHFLVDYASFIKKIVSKDKKKERHK